MEPRQARSESERSDSEIVEAFIDDVTFPVTKLRLIEHARQRAAPVRVLEVLARLPQSGFNRVEDVLDAVQEAGAR